MKKQHLITIGLTLLVGIGSFFGGMKYQESQGINTISRQGQSGTNGQGRFTQGQNGQARFGGNGQNRPVMGEIISSDENSITVKMQDGSSKIVLLTDKTTISKTSDAPKTELATGVKVMAIGAQNTDGSFSATQIQLNPTFLGFDGRVSPTQNP